MHYHALLAIRLEEHLHQCEPRAIFYGMRTTLESPHKEHGGAQLSEIIASAMARDHTGVSCPSSLTALLQRCL